MQWMRVPGNIKVIIKDAGKTLIQVVDNGSGMSEVDAERCFERHATSKISSAEDLFSIRTSGFRGEALASMAAVAEVTLKTRRREDELGTQIRMAGSKLESIGTCSGSPRIQFSDQESFFQYSCQEEIPEERSDRITAYHQ